MAEVQNQTEAASTGVAVLNATLPTLKPFDENNIAEWGNGLLLSLIQQTAFEEELASAQEAGQKVTKFIGFEMSKALMTIAEKDNKVNLFAVFEGAKAVEKLNTKVLEHLGVIKRDIKDDDIVITWTSEAMQKQYDYSAIDKEKDENEYNRRFNNRKRLNMRISDAAKFAIGLLDGGTKAADLKLVEKDGDIKAVIENAPDFLVGDKEKNGGTTTVEFGKRTPNEGAKIAPTLATVIKVATEKHAKKDEAKPNPDGRADKGGDRSGDAKLGISDEDFGGFVNNLRRVITAQEGVFTEEMLRQMKALVPFIDETLKSATVKKPEPPKTEAKAEKKAEKAEAKK